MTVQNGGLRRDREVLGDHNITFTVIILLRLWADKELEYIKLLVL